jgi:lipoprotein Spr
MVRMMKAVLIGLLLLTSLTSCQGTPRYGGGYHSVDADRPESGEPPARQANAVDPIALGRIIDRYLGKPYAGQDETQKGFDCSEFVGTVFEEYASIHLPRTTENLFKAGRKIEPGDLFFGDLVFYDTGGKGVSHVGIFVGFGEFVHSSSTSGIVISSMDDKYYKKRFIGARRVLE